MSPEVMTALTTGVTGLADSGTDVILLIIPLCILLGGTVWLTRKALSWFRSLSK